METNLLDTFNILFTRKIKEGRNIYLITENWVILIIKIAVPIILIISVMVDYMNAIKDNDELSKTSKLAVTKLTAAILVFLIPTFVSIIAGVVNSGEYKKCIGNITGLNTLWVLFAVFLGGKLFGILGMFLGVPVFAVLYETFIDYMAIRRKNIEVEKALLEEDKVNIE